MKVCLLNDSFPPVIDGVANVVMNYAKIMQTEGLADVMVGTPKYPNADYKCYPYYVIPYQSFDTTKLVNGYRAGNPLDIKELHEMSEFAPDIIHSHCPITSTVLARMLRAKTDVPLVFTYHTKFDVDIAKAVKAKFIQKETIRALVNNIEACDEVWVVSHGAGENLKSLGYEGDYRVVSNGVDFAKGRVSDENVKKATEGYDLPEGVPMFLFVGRMVTYKGLPLILDAMAKLAAKGQDFRMVFVGSGVDEKAMKDKARELGLYENPDTAKPGKCIFTGAIYDRDVLRAWNTRADLFLFPSTYDTNGIVVREAAACGLASVLIKDSCAAEGITHDHNGYMIEETADAMCELLAQVCKDMDHMHQVGQNAMDEIYISWEESVHAAYDRYGEIIEAKKNGLYPSRKRIVTDHFKDFAVDLFEDTREMVHLPKRMFDNMLDNVEEFHQEMKEGMSEVTDNIKEEVKEKLRKFF